MWNPDPIKAIALRCTNMAGFLAGAGAKEKGLLAGAGHRCAPMPLEVAPYNTSVHRRTFVINWT
jgi:hypothetical protein